MGKTREQKASTAARAAVFNHPAVQAVIDAIDEHIAGYKMTDVLSQDDFLDGFSELLERAGSVLTELAGSWRTDTPLDAEIADFMEDLGADYTAMSTTAEDLYERWYGAHEYHINRAREPRPGEEKLDVEPAA